MSFRSSPDPGRCISRPLPVLLVWTGMLLPFCFHPSEARADLPPLIPREVLFQNSERDQPRLSPDGSRIAYLGLSERGVPNVWVRSIGSMGDSMVTHNERTGVPGFAWAPDGSHLLFFQDSEGDENTHLFSLDLATGILRDLTPFQGYRAQNLITEPGHPSHVLAGINLRDPRFFDMYKIDLATGGVVLEAENPGDVIDWTADPDLAIRAATALDPETVDTILRVRDTPGSPWRELVRWKFEEAGIDIYRRVISFLPDGKTLLVQSPDGTNTTHLAKLDLATGREIETVAADPGADLWNVLNGASLVSDVVILQHPVTGEVQAAAVNGGKPEWRILDPSLQIDFNILSRAAPGIPLVVDRDASGNRWIVEFLADDRPAVYYFYDRNLRRADILFETEPSLRGYILAPMRPLTIQSRDGLTLSSYLTLPIGAPLGPLPMVLLVHGGPWWRSDWGYDTQVQWLANRGYAVLDVNFRGSTGFGKAFLNASTGQMGVGGMQNDLTDAVRWAIDTGIADPKRIGIMGASYGGYATLAGLAFTPDLYACGVDIVGPSDLRTSVGSFPPYWAPKIRRWLLRIGNVLEDDDLNRRISPLYHVDAIRAPLLVAQGAHDPRVRMEQSDSIVRGMRARNLMVTYVVYPDEGHGFARPENNQDFYGRAEEFLARHLGGRAEPFKEVPGSSAEMR